MVLTKQWIALFLTASIGACTSAPGEMGGDSPDEKGDDGDDPVQPDDDACTPETDDPISEIASAIDHNGGVGAAARAADGTVYFVSYYELDRAEISRRAPCGQIETNWLSMTVPVEDLEVSSDNQLYIASSGGGSFSTLTGRLYRLDLDDPNALPSQIASYTAQAIGSLSIGPDGRVFFVVRGPSDTAVYLLDGETMPAKVLDMPSANGSVAAKSDGSAFVFREQYGNFSIGRLTVSATGTGNIVFQNIADGGANDYRIYDLRADGGGGFYAMHQRLLGSKSDYTLYHSPLMTGARTVVGELKNVTNTRVAYALDGDPKAAVLLAPEETTQATRVSLPVALMMP